MRCHSARSPSRNKRAGREKRGRKGLRIVGRGKKGREGCDKDREVREGKERDGKGEQG